MRWAISVDFLSSSIGAVQIISVAAEGVACVVSFDLMMGMNVSLYSVFFDFLIDVVVAFANFLKNLPRD